MQENQSKSDYTSIRRRHFLWVAFSLVMFGAILYFANVFNDYAKKNDIGNFDDIKNQMMDVLKKDFTMFPENSADNDMEESAAKEDKSANILKAPLILDCSVENGRALIKEPFEVAKNKVTNAVFELTNHGKTLYSLDFSSKENQVFCRGTLKEGQQKIFVYYCEKI